MRSVSFTLGMAVLAFTVSLVTAEAPKTTDPNSDTPNADAPKVNKNHQAVSYNKDIRPLLSDRCFACHGPDASKRQSSLRLDIDTGDESPFLSRNGQTTIDPGNPDTSELWKRLTTDDPTLHMPPTDSGKKPLTNAQKELVQQWIRQGAKYERFWSLETLHPQTLPSVLNEGWPTGRIDRFVLETLERRDKRPQPTADKRTLIRRVTLDLTGLPPTPDEIHAFEQDDSPDSYLKLEIGRAHV